jgi:hypothetical protein
MPYILQTSFDIDNDDIDQLQIGRSLQLSLAYLKAYLANEPGFINARAMYALEHEKRTHVYFESTWEDWGTLTQHREKSAFAEDKMLHRFEMSLTPHDLVAHVLEEIE